MSAGGKTTVLAICGSLRAKSSSRSAVLAAKALAPVAIVVDIYDELGGLPHFNPDLEGEPLPASVVDIRHRVRTADALLICSPEYAHGVPGVMKNVLDWLVSGGELMGKRVGVINASPGSRHAHAALVETLKVLMAEVFESSLPLPRNSMTAADIVADAALSQALEQALRALVPA